LRSGPAVAAQAFEFVEGLVESALQAGFVAGQVVDGAVGVEIALDSVGEVIGVLDGGVFAFEILRRVDHFQVPVRGFGVADAADAPGGGHHLLNEKDLGGGGGRMLGEEVVAEGVELRLLLMIDDEALSGESMANGVKARRVFACFGLGAGALLSVAAVGFNLTLG
jgi:hypothetical protein